MAVWMQLKSCNFRFAVNAEDFLPKVSLSWIGSGVLVWRGEMRPQRVSEFLRGEAFAA